MVTMKKLLFVCVILLAGCTGVNKGSVKDVDSTSCENDTLVENTISTGGSLNDIRFANYTEKIGSITIICESCESILTIVAREI